MLEVFGHRINKLYYKSTGQPILPFDSKEHISVSHSKNWFAVYVSDNPVGVDIEVERASIVNGKDWFINHLESPKYQSCQSLHLVWGAKEAYYKKKEGIIYDPKSEVIVKEINKYNISIIHNNVESILFYREIENTYLVWTEE